MKKLISLANRQLQRFSGSSQSISSAANDPTAKLVNAVEQLQGRDKVGVASEAVVVACSAATGAAVSGTVAAAAGATTLLGSSTLAGALGGVFVASTPVGWIVGSAAVASVIGLGVIQLVRSGGKQDRVREHYRNLFGARLTGLQVAEPAPQPCPLHELTVIAIAENALTQATADRLLALVERGSLSQERAIQRVTALRSCRSDADRSS